MQVLNKSGKMESEIDLPESMLNKHYNFDLVHQFVSIYVHNSHQNTKGQKNRSAVSGGGRKPWRQKGTGRARAGTIRSPIWRSGGVTFAHVFKPSKKKLNKKMYRAALRSIFFKLIQEERLVLIDSLEINSPPKTSDVKRILKNLDLFKVVFVLNERDENFELASKNLFNVRVQTVHSLNPLELINAEKVIFTSSAIKSIEEVITK